MDLIRQTGPAGISISELEAVLRGASRRSLQRVLRNLADGKQIVMRGQARGARYYAMAPSLRQGFGFATSPEADRVWQQMQAPLGQRTPVGYNPAFIKSYRPNVTHHLSAPQRQHLRGAGTLRSPARADTRGREITDRLLIDLAWASSHMEGNTYDLLSTERLIHEGVAAAGKSRDETQMILNHKSAIEFLLSGNTILGVNKLTICNLHSLLSENLLHNPDDSGRVRSHPVNVGQSVYVPPVGGTLLEEDLIQMLGIVRAVKDPYEQAFCLFVYLPYLQPFTDVNKRTSRLAANVPLVMNNLCPLSFMGVETSVYASAMLGVYELNDVSLARDLFIYACERSVQQYLAVDQSLAPPDPIRMAHRQLIFSGVASIVRNVPADKEVYAKEFVMRNGGGKSDTPESKQIVHHILNDLAHLHEGNFYRYGIPYEEFQKWENAGKTAGMPDPRPGNHQ
ncbi:MAG: Fic family protein [Gammaproteobacteria bacterium]